MIAVGVDTHKDSHSVAALDSLGEVIGERSFAANRQGYAELLSWSEELASSEPEALAFGIEGAGAYGAGLTEQLAAAGCQVFEVERPRRRGRRKGKSDRIDALAAAKQVLAGEGLSRPKARGRRGALGALLVVRDSVIGERTRVLNQIQALRITAPIELRERLGEGSGSQLERRLRTLRPRPGAGIEAQATLGALRDLAARSRKLDRQARAYEQRLRSLVSELDPTLLEEVGVGPISAARLLAFDPARCRSEAAFARCNGTAPVPASSGKTVRHRLSRGGDRQLNAAIYMIALTRSVHDPETRAFLDRKISEGKTKREAMRSLKRHISRRLYKRLVLVPLTS